MLLSHATHAAPDVRVNEDLVVTGPDFAVVLDGATQAAGVDTGCVHDVPWLVARLGGSLAQLLLTRADDVADLLAQAIETVMAEHAHTCDLSNPDSPSTTAAILRQRADVVDYLVLADSPIVLREHAGEVTMVLDDRIDHLPAYTVETVREHRNAPGGFWVAGTDPAAAYEALAGSVETSRLDCAGVFTDGASRLVEHHGMQWADLLDLLDRQGPEAVIERVRHEDQCAAGQRPGKVHDDATAVLCRVAPRSG